MVLHMESYVLAIGPDSKLPIALASVTVAIQNPSLAFASPEAIPDRSNSLLAFCRIGITALRHVGKGQSDFAISC